MHKSLLAIREFWMSPIPFYVREFKFWSTSYKTWWPTLIRLTSRGCWAFHFTDHSTVQNVCRITIKAIKGSIMQRSCLCHNFIVNCFVFFYQFHVFVFIRSSYVIVVWCMLCTPTRPLFTVYFSLVTTEQFTWKWNACTERSLDKHYGFCSTLVWLEFSSDNNINQITTWCEAE